MHIYICRSSIYHDSISSIVKVSQSQGGLTASVQCNNAPRLEHAVMKAFIVTSKKQQLQNTNQSTKLPTVISCNSNPKNWCLQRMIVSGTLPMSTWQFYMIPR